MKKHFFSLVVLLVTAMSGYAQIDVTWGVPLKTPRKTDISGVVGSDKDHFYVQRNSYRVLSSSKFYLEKYKRSDMSLEFSKEILLEDAQGHDRNYEGLYMIGTKLLLFTSQYDGKLDKRTAYIQTIDSAGNVGAASEIDAISADKKRNSGSYSFIISDDSTRILMLRNEPFEKYANEKFTFKVFDENMNKIWEKALELPYKDKEFSLNNYRVDNDGNVYMLASLVKDQANVTRKDRRTKPQYYYNILFYDHTTDKLNEYVVDLGTQFISEITFTVDKAGDLVCAGFYSNKSASSVIGTFYLKIDRVKKSISVKGTKDFDKDFLEMFMSKRRSDKGDELYNYDLRKLVIRADGGAVLVGEQYYMYVVSYRDPKTGAVTYTYHYYYNDIIVVSIGADGKISWARRIPKAQHSVNDGGYYSSFAFSVNGDKMYFMYNDNPKSAALPLEPKVVNGKTQPTYKPLNKVTKAAAMLVIVDISGNMERQTMFSNKDLKIILRPKVALQVDDNHMFALGVKGSTYKFAEIKFN